MNKPYSPKPEKKSVSLPIFTSKVAAGFPSPAEDYVEGTLDLNEYFITNPPTTFYVKVSGESMINIGIYPEDILIVDRSLSPTDKKIVIAIIDGELVVKRLRLFENHVELHSENHSYEPIIIKKTQELSIWGIVVGTVRKF